MSRRNCIRAQNCVGMLNVPLQYDEDWCGHEACTSLGAPLSLSYDVFAQEGCQRVWNGPEQPQARTCDGTGPADGQLRLSRHGAMSRRPVEYGNEA